MFVYIYMCVYTPRACFISTPGKLLLVPQNPRRLTTSVTAPGTLSLVSEGMSPPCLPGGGGSGTVAPAEKTGLWGCREHGDERGGFLRNWVLTLGRLQGWMGGRLFRLNRNLPPAELTRLVTSQSSR